MRERRRVENWVDRIGRGKGNEERGGRMKGGNRESRRRRRRKKAIGGVWGLKGRNGVVEDKEGGRWEGGKGRWWCVCVWVGVCACVCVCEACWRENHKKVN